MRNLYAFPPNNCHLHNFLMNIKKKAYRNHDSDSFYCEWLTVVSLTCYTIIALYMQLIMWHVKHILTPEYI